MNTDITVVENWSDVFNFEGANNDFRMDDMDFLRKQNFEAYQKMKMKDLVDFQQQYIKGQKKFYLILGKESEIDFNRLAKFGKVTKLTLDQIFGY
jgi:hypothetical protein